MEGFDIETIALIPRISRQQVSRLVQNEPSSLPVTKSLLNLLYNIVQVGSVPVSQTQKAYLDSHSELVLALLTKTRSLKWKKTQLERNPALVINIAASCPTVAGSS